MKQRTLLAAASVAFLTWAVWAQPNRSMQPVPLPLAQPRSDDSAFQGKTFRVQLLLLEIKEKAQHPKLLELRRAAQEAKSPAESVLAMADEIVAAGVGAIVANTTTICEHGVAQRSNFSSGIPTTLTYKNAEGKAVTERGFDSVDTTFELTARAREAGASLSARVAFGRRPLTSMNAPQERRNESYEWSGSWSGRTPSVVILHSSIPRESGVEGNERPTERYLLMSIAEAE